MSFNISRSTKEKSSFKIVDRLIKADLFPQRTVSNCLTSAVLFMELTKPMEKMCPKAEDLVV